MAICIHVSASHVASAASHSIQPAESSLLKRGQ